MARTVCWFSAGAPSAVATMLTLAEGPATVAMCDTGSEHKDSARFRKACESWFGQPVEMLKSESYNDTWDLWEKRRYLSGVNGALCTSELKVIPRLMFEREDDTHVFGYTADKADVVRSQRLIENWPRYRFRFPLIEKGLTKANCLAMVSSAGISPPEVYAMGLPNANCIPCVKATSLALGS